MVPIHYYFVLSALLFIIGTCGVLMRKNLFIILLSVEIMLNATNLSFVASSKLWAQTDGQVFSLFVIAIAASEVAVGLAIAILLFRHRGSLNPDQLHAMKW